MTWIFVQGGSGYIVVVFLLHRLDSQVNLEEERTLCHCGEKERSVRCTEFCPPWMDLEKHESRAISSRVESYLHDIQR